MKDLALMVKKLERKQKDSYQFKNTGIAKQAEFLQQAGDWLEDSLKTKLEKEKETPAPPFFPPNQELVWYRSLSENSFLLLPA